MKLQCLAAFSLLCCGAFAAPAQAADLGDPAPALQIADWIKGTPVDLAAAKGKKFTVVEFWATWCGPCRTSIPHLTELARKFKAKDVQFVGVSDEEAGVVRKFVEGMGDKMDYTVATDKGRKTSQGYMEAYGIGGIPHAFVVDKEGRIVWHGHPMAELEETIQQLIAGKFDLAVAKKKAKAESLLEEFHGLAAENKDEARLAELQKELEALAKEAPAAFPDGKFDAAAVRQQARFGFLLNQYRQAAFQGRPAAELDELAKQAEAGAPAGVKFADVRQDVALQVAFNKYMRLVTTQADDPKTEALARDLEAAKSKDPMLLNQVAWVLLTEKRIKKRDLALAAKIAKAAYDASEGKDPSIIDTYARSLFETGKTEEAIRYQKQALEACQDAELRKQFEATLKEYQQKGGGK